MSMTFGAALALTVSGLALQTHQIDPRQLKCLSEALYYEAGNQTFQGKIAVANVIMNRSKAKDKSPCFIIKQPYQFSYLKSKAYKSQTIRMKDPKTKIALRMSVVVAYNVLRGKFPDLTQGAKFYLNPVVATDLSWSKVFVRTAIIGDHHFYRKSDQS